MGESGRNPSQYGRERRERRGVYFRAGCAGSPDGGQGRESDHGNADSFGNHLTNAFSAICCLQKSRFTASKPSIFAIASDEKFIRHLVTSFHQRSLSQSQYQNDPTKPNFGTLTATTYGNGAKVSSRYDDFNRVTGVVYGEETAPRYEYDYNAKGQVARVRDNLLNRTTQSEYDLANRPVRVKTSEDAKHVYTGQVAYDNVYGNLSEFTEKVGENRQEFGTKFGYDDENRPTSLTYSASGKEIGQSTTTIDKLNRTTFSAVKLGSKTFTSEYHFAAGGYGTGSVTNLVASITQPGCNCGYGYDDNGNIASATLNGKWTGYTYDALGQLVQVNDHSDTRSGASGTTWKYTYDLGGNILKKERFAYADTTNPLETVTYTYGDANWRDKLTAVNGNAIAYDAIGNPLNDGTWTYTWQNGRQLQKMQKSGVTAEFVYNADGLRVQKTVNGVVTKYTLHGKNVVHMTSGTDELHFFYDAQNRPAVVVYNGTAYAYVKSLQGDIVAILDESGNAVVSYGYDAWGAPLWCTGELAETLGKVQPFRYRGYVFDEETGLYYLRSRYYNPQWGRFANADALIGAGKLLSHNLFAYCSNCSVCYTDASGFEEEQKYLRYVRCAPNTDLVLDTGVIVHRGDVIISVSAIFTGNMSIITLANGESGKIKNKYISNLKPYKIEDIYGEPEMGTNVELDYRHVRNLQFDLYALGYYSDERDGIYGEHTAEAVENFRIAEGFSEGKYAGPKVKNRLFEIFYERYDDIQDQLEQAYWNGYDACRKDMEE